MPRFFFHSQRDQLHIDEEGIDLPTLDVARAEAMQTAGKMLRDGALNHQMDDEVPWRLRVTDGPGATGITVVSVHILQSGPPTKLAIPHQSTEAVV